MTNLEIVISEKDNVSAILEDKKPVQFFFQSGVDGIGNIILGRISSIFSPIQAAFVDIGTGKSGFLHITDLANHQKDRGKTIEQILKQDQPILVQVLKDPTGGKGVRLTAEPTLAGRFLVFTPFNRKVGVSQKIELEKERKRLTDAINEIKDRNNYGAVIRTEADGQSKEVLQEEFYSLMEQWNKIQAIMKKKNPPVLLHQEEKLLYKVLREFGTDEITKVVIDSVMGRRKAQNLLKSWGCKAANNVQYHNIDTSILNHYNILSGLDEALRPKVDLPSGGSIVIEHTEAFTAIDVNSGKLNNF